MVEPAYAITLPSLDDDTKLECRIYHPQDLSTSRGLKGAILAHPYGPFGGCYDDPVILEVTKSLLERHFVVGTFNFRGSGGSQGKTSWTGRAETGDYVSVTGILIYYLHHLSSHINDIADGATSQILPVVEDSIDGKATQTVESRHGAIQLLLGGYSYGSLVLAKVPPMTAIVQSFEQASIGTAGAEIIMRARTLANQTLQTLRERRTSTRTLDSDSPTGSPRPKPSPVTIGGEETDSSTRRSSRDSTRSSDIVRKTAEVPQRLVQQIRRRSDAAKSKTNSPVSSTGQVPTGRSIQAARAMPTVSASYLLISPVVLPFLTVLAPPGPGVPPFYQRKTHAEGTGLSFHEYPTLAVFGDADVFTSSRRLRAWAERTEVASARSNFRWKQIHGAGHFWREANVMKDLNDEVLSWLAGLPLPQ